jgi:hypothetical protein
MFPNLWQYSEYSRTKARDYCVFSDDPLGPTDASFYFGDQVALETTVAKREIKTI